jgi:bifunctional DNA-binding transcriptional regulator/antitoxin component of YhaV-PrlF toxin-antitoxin module
MTENFTCKVDNQGRLSLPARLRKQAGIEPDSEVLAFFEDGGVVALTREAALAQVQRMAREARGNRKGSVVDEFLVGRRREAEDEAREAPSRHGRHRKSA